MIRRREVIFVGIIAAVVIIALILSFSTSSFQSSVSQDHPDDNPTIGPTFSPTQTMLVCPPPLHTIYLLTNIDKKKSHSFQVTVNDASNRSLSEESFQLDPGEIYSSPFRISGINETPYYLIFGVDNTTIYYETISDEYLIRTYEYDPIKGISASIVWSTDYGCPVTTPTP